MKGKIGTIIDKEDEHGNIVVQVLDSAAHVILKRQDIKKPAKAARESLLKVIEDLHEESLQKELQLSELQSVINTAPTTGVLPQSERDKIAADAIAVYKQSQAEKKQPCMKNSKLRHWQRLTLKLKPRIKLFND
jgi:hypothetical protein